MDKEKLNIYESFEDFLNGYLFPKILKPNELKKNKKHRYHYSATKKCGPFIGNEDENNHWIQWCIKNPKTADNIFESKVMEQSKNSVKFNFYANADKDSVVIVKHTNKVKKETGNRAIVTASRKTDREQSIKKNKYIPCHQAGEKIILREKTEKTT